MDIDGTSLREVLDAADTAFAVTDRRCHVRWVNRGMADLLELAPDQCHGRSLPTLLVGAPESQHTGLVLSFRTGEDHRWLEVRCDLLPETSPDGGKTASPRPNATSGRKPSSAWPTRTR
jgi:PAS domain-containing protein